MTTEDRKFVRLNYRNSTLSEMSRQIKIPIPTIHYFCKQMGFKPYKKGEKLKEYIENNPTASNTQISEALNRSYNSIAASKCNLKKGSVLI